MEAAIEFFTSWWTEPAMEEGLPQRMSDDQVSRDEHKSSTRKLSTANKIEDPATSNTGPRSVHGKFEFNPGRSVRNQSSILPACLPARQTVEEGNDSSVTAVSGGYPIPEEVRVETHSSSLATMEKRSKRDQEGKPTTNGKKGKSRHPHLPPLQEEVPKQNDSFESKRTESTKASDSTPVVSVEEKMPDEEGYIPLDATVHFSSMPFGRSRTAGAIFLTLLGLILAIFSKRSLQFVKLEEPVYISDYFSAVSDFGMVRLQMCYTDDFLESREFGGDSSIAMPYLNGAVDVEESAHREPCFILRLSTSIIEDTMWEVSRLSTSMAIALGAFFCIMMISTVRWESINLKPIVAGLLATYLFQSFSFFFYDTDLCRQHSCKLGVGTYLSMLASFCWFGAAMIAILMDVDQTKKMRQLARRERRRQRRLERRMKRKSTTATGRTDSRRSDSDNGPPPAVVMERHPDEGVLWQV
jgi:hypothetical protein